MNLKSILKMLGIKIPDETMRQIEVLIPQLPQKVNELIAMNSAAVKNFDERLARIEDQLVFIGKVLETRYGGRASSSVGEPVGTDLRTNSTGTPGRN